MLRFLFSIFRYIGTLKNFINSKDFSMRITVRMSYLHEHRICSSVFCLTLSLSTVIFSRAFNEFHSFVHCSNSPGHGTTVRCRAWRIGQILYWVLVTIVIVSIYKNKSSGQHKNKKSTFKLDKWHCYPDLDRTNEGSDELQNEIE